MNALFAPVSRLMRGRSKVKQIVGAALLMLPLAIALVAHPPGWTAVGLAILVTYLLAVYYLAALLFTTDAAWADIHRVAELLGEHDLRSTPPMPSWPPPTATGAATWASSSRR